MNNQRRKLLREAQFLIAKAYALVDEAGNDEQDAYDNLTEGLRSSERGERMSEVADDLIGLASELEDMDARLEDACQ